MKVRADGDGVRRKALVLAVGTLGALGLAGCGGTEVATEAAVGECFQDPDDTSEVGELDKVDCDEPHDNEVFAVFDLEDGEFPGDTEVQDLAEQGCIERFEGYVGSDYEESELNVFSISPTEETWTEADDREVICAAYAVDESPLEGSVKDSGR